MLIEKIDTSVTADNPRSSTNAPRIASAPTNNGSEAATSPPKTRTSSTSTIGVEIDSAFTMSCSVCVFTSSNTATSPPTFVSSPVACERTCEAILWNVASRSSCVAPASVSTAYVLCWSFDTNAGDLVLQYVATPVTSAVGSPDKCCSTDCLNPGSATVEDGLR
jgi:hypothetical protein